MQDMFAPIVSEVRLIIYIKGANMHLYFFNVIRLLLLLLLL